MYQGEAKLSAQYFRGIGFTMPEFSNPADTYMKILAVKYPPTKKDLQKIDYFVKCYKDKVEPGVLEEMKQLTLDAPDLKAMERTQAGIRQQIKLLNARNFKGIARNPMQSKAKVGQQIFFALMMICVFTGIGFQNEGGLDDKVTADKATEPLKYAAQLNFAAFDFYSASYFLTINTFMGNFFNTLIVFQ